MMKKVLKTLIVAFVLTLVIVPLYRLSFNSNDNANNATAKMQTVISEAEFCFDGVRTKIIDEIDEGEIKDAEHNKKTGMVRFFEHIKDTIKENAKIKTGR